MSATTTQIMMPRHRTRTLAGTFAAILVMVSCASAPPKPSKAKVTLAASADSNPDSGGRASPVVVRVYQLKTDAVFTGADFFALFDDDQKVLGQELIGRDEFVVAPSEKRTVEVAVAKTARFVGVVAAFRDIRNSQWRVVVPAPLKKDDMTVAVERARVTFTPTK